jgi:hypothetical protein
MNANNAQARANKIEAIERAVAHFFVSVRSSPLAI